MGKHSQLGSEATDDQPRILIVDDDESACNSLALILRRRGYRVHTAATAQEALSQAREHSFGLGMLDLRLPDIEGLDLLAALKRSYPEMALFIVTGYASLNSALQAMNRGADGYIAKPLNMDEVLARIQGILDRQRLVREKQRLEAQRDAVLGTLQQRNRQLELLHLAGQAIGSTLDLDQVLTAVLEAVRRLLDIAAASVWLADPVSGDLVCRQATGPQSEAVSGWRLAPGEGLAGCVVSSGESLIVPDSQADARHFKGVDDSTGIVLRSILSVPLRAKGGVFGVLQAADVTVGRFDATDLVMLEPLAASAAIAIENAQLYERAQHEIAERMRAEEALRQHAERLDNLHRMDQAVLAAHSPAEIAEVALSHLQMIPSYRWASAVAFDLRTRRATVLATHVRPAGDTEPGDGVPLNLMWDVQDLREGEIKIKEDGASCHVGVSLVAHGSPIGMLVMGLDDAASFTMAHRDAVHEVASSLAIAIENARLYEQVRTASERLQVLSRRLVEAQESERRHIARELHDEVGQALTSVIINLQAAQRAADVSAPLPQLEDALSTARSTLEQVRDLSLDLRPSLLDDLGLVPALRWYSDRYARRAGLAVHFTADPLTERLPMAVEITCFRIVQEALTNVVRHAHAQQVAVELRREKTQLHLAVRDDGCGFDVEQALERATHGASMGLLGMQERALFAGGQLHVESAPGRGTELCAHFPMTGMRSEGERLA